MHLSGRRTLFFTSTIVFIFLNGCNDSESSSTYQSAQHAYNLHMFTYATISMHLEGIGYGNPMEGSYLSRYTGDLNYNGVILAVRENILKIDGETYTNHKGYYRDTQFGIKTEERTCTAPSVVALTPTPETVYIGYRNEATFQCTDGAVFKVEHGLTDAGNGNADYTIVSKLMTETDTTVTEEHYIITPTMDIIGYRETIQGGGWDLQVKATQINVE